ncbi:hypothetical protein ACIPVB_09150 [Microbacterium sp. NPDC090007]|uniref:hypothetical protein n=1 Tax=Microbacterium sp. NPDC090007 TaxID=3364204 RepID=UPI003813A825
MQKQTWADYVATNSNGERKNVIAGKSHVDPATVGRWMSGASTPQPLQVIAFARAYGLSPIPGLIAAGHLTPDDVGDGVVIQSTPTLDNIATHALVDELERRLEVMSDYAGWIRSIASGSPSPANLSADALRYVDPAQPPSNVRGEDFIEALATHLEPSRSIDGKQTYRPVQDLAEARRARDVGTPTQDGELYEAARPADPEPTDEQPSYDDPS